MEPRTANVLRVWRSATPEQHAQGTSWYAHAHGAAASLDPDPKRAAGVIAALSPRNSWPRNLELAARAYSNNNASGTLGRSCQQANDILAGADPLDVLGGPKVRAFYQCIVDSGTQAVCIDRHSTDVAVGTRLSLVQREGIVLHRANRYEQFADVYRRAAKRMGVSAPVMQAVTWVTWRDLYGGTRTAA
jgi:hypothetical protein